MKTRSAFKLVSVVFLALSISTVSFAQSKKDIKDEVGQSEKAAKVVTEIMDTPDKGIPQNLLDSASCVAVFPSVLKAGFVVGGEGGRGDSGSPGKSAPSGALACAGVWALRG